MRFNEQVTRTIRKTAVSAGALALVGLLVSVNAVPTRADQGSGKGGSGTSGGSGGGGTSGGGGDSGGSGGGSSLPLSSVLIPAPPDLTTYVRNQQALIILGKALFWDMQTGNDGKQACATCHFHAGADHRGSSQMNPNGGPYAPNYTYGALDFPFHTRQVGGSAGVFYRHFNDVVRAMRSTRDCRWPIRFTTWEESACAVSPAATRPR